MIRKTDKQQMIKKFQNSNMCKLAHYKPYRPREIISIQSHTQIFASCVWYFADKCQDNDIKIVGRLSLTVSYA